MAEQAALSVVLLAYGGPQSAHEVEPFLRRIMGPGSPSSEQLARALRRYEAIGGGSPLVANTLLQCGALQAYFDGVGARSLSRAMGGPASVAVFAGMRHTPPWVAEVVGQALDTGGGRAVGVIMASHQSERATGGYHDDARRALAESAEAGRSAEAQRAPEVIFVRPWHTSPPYLEAVAARTVTALARLAEGEPGEGRIEGHAGGTTREGRIEGHAGGTTVVFSAHSLPLTEGRGDPEYEQGLFDTARGVMALVGDLPWRIAYQSRSGRPGLEWLGPGVDEVLAEEAARGAAAVVVVPLGFVVEHLETLYDLDVALRAEADRLGITMARAGTVLDHPAFIEAVGEAVVRAVQEAGWRLPSGKESHERR